MALLAPEWDWARCAVIARNWRSLDPVRSYCEVKGIPVQQADEDSNGFWSLRETQSLIGWLRARNSGLIDVGMITRWLELRPEGDPCSRWWACLREAVAQYALDAGDPEIPLDHFPQRLAEWDPEARRRQHGL